MVCWRSAIPPNNSDKEKIKQVHLMSETSSPSQSWLTDTTRSELIKRLKITSNAISMLIERQNFPASFHAVIAATLDYPGKINAMQGDLANDSKHGFTLTSW